MQVLWIYIYSDCLDKMEIPRSKLETSTLALYGFIGNIMIMPNGIKELPITIGKRTCMLIVMSNFLVLKGGDQYNVII